MPLEVPAFLLAFWDVMLYYDLLLLESFGRFPSLIPLLYESFLG